MTIVLAACTVVSLGIGTVAFLAGMFVGHALATNERDL